MGLGPPRDVALILLIVETAVIVLPAGVLLYFCVRGLLHLKRLARTYLPMAAQYAQRMATTTRLVSGKLVEPLVTLRVWRAQAGAMTSAARQGLRHRRN
jgi:hypothetical protein